jgi:hypothetical protein
MGRLYDARLRIEKAIAERKLDVFQVKGKIGLKAGMLLASISPGTPDDEAQLKKLAAAAKDVLDINI